MRFCIFACWSVSYCEIVRLQLKEVYRLLAEQHLQIEIGTRFKGFLVQEGYSPKFGLLKRLIQKHIYNPLSRYLLGKVQSRIVREAFWTKFPIFAWYPGSGCRFPDQKGRVMGTSVLICPSCFVRLFLGLYNCSFSVRL